LVSHFQLFGFDKRLVTLDPKRMFVCGLECLLGSVGGTEGENSQVVGRPPVDFDHALQAELVAEFVASQDNVAFADLGDVLSDVLRLRRGGGRDKR
jgi:hypothetical protein